MFENSGVNRFQSYLISVGKTDNHFWAALSSVVCISAARL